MVSNCYVLLVYFLSFLFHKMASHCGSIKLCFGSIMVSFVLIEVLKINTSTHSLSLTSSNMQNLLGERPFEKSSKFFP